MEMTASVALVSREKKRFAYARAIRVNTSSGTTTSKFAARRWRGSRWWLLAVDLITFRTDDIRWSARAMCATCTQETQRLVTRLRQLSFPTFGVLVVSLLQKKRREVIAGSTLVEGTR